MMVMARLRQLLTGSSLFLVDEMVLDTADDGSHSVSIPMLGHGTVIIAPEQDRPDRWAVLFVTMAGITVSAKNVAPEELVDTVIRHLVPGANKGGTPQ